MRRLMQYLLRHLLRGISIYYRKRRCLAKTRRLTPAARVSKLGLAVAT
ncbi:MAG: hypothetical protein ACRCUY_03295 [Thermoguttaceae bacterium]